MKSDDLRIPSHAFLLSAFLPALAAVTRIALHGEVGAWSLVIWLVGLVPIFLLTRYMGWRGALLALAWVSAMVILAELFAATLSERLPDWSLVGLVVAVAASVALGAGLDREWWSKRLPQGSAERSAAGREADELPAGDVLAYFIQKLFESARRRPPLTVVLLEVDRYDDYADMYGKERVAGAIDVVVTALHSRTRASNVYGRIDARTMVVLLQGEGLSAAHALASRVFEEIEGLPAPWSGRITLSAGVAGFDPSMPNSDALLAQARQALETALRMGGDRIVVSQGASDETLITSGMTVLQTDGQVREIRSTV